MPLSVVILGGGVAGLAAAYELAKLQREGADVRFTLVEASNRLGGILETQRHPSPDSGGEFVVECGPDGWVSEKPWAREVAIELGLQDELLPSNDAERVTYVLHGGRLEPMPEGMRMMVPSSTEAIGATPLFNDEARAAYAAEPGRAEELKRSAPDHDESVASFVERHFGAEVLHTVGAPLLGGIFGGDVRELSVRSVMKPFVEMERDFGSLILAAEARSRQQAGKPRAAIFTSLRRGTGVLAESMAATLPAGSTHLRRRVIGLSRNGSKWEIATELNVGAHGVSSIGMQADAVLLALPVLSARELLRPIDSQVGQLMTMRTSSAAIVAFGFTADQAVQWPKGFGFLVPEGEGSAMLAGTFSDQKYACRVPAGGRLVRAYYGGIDTAPGGGELALSNSRSLPYQNAKADLERILGPLPAPALTVTRVWPRALPQYAVGHGDRMAELHDRTRAMGGLDLLGNGYRGVGLPELIRDGREAARRAAQPA